MPVDPQMKLWIEEDASYVRGQTLEEQRERSRTRRVIRVEDQNVPVLGGEGIWARAYTPPIPPDSRFRPLPVLVYFHGGGWVTGDRDAYDFRCRIMAEWCKCLVVSIDYRCAPEYKFPTAVNDSYEALRWVASAAVKTEPGVDVDLSRIGVAGESSGANLAAAVSLLARDQGPRLIYQQLICPVLDETLSTRSMERNALGPGLTKERMIEYWDQYVPNKEDRRNPLASPLWAQDLKGLPPALVMTARYDPLLDEGRQYANRLEESGVEVDYKECDGLVHGFFDAVGSVDSARSAFIESLDSIKRRMRP